MTPAVIREVRRRGAPAEVRIVDAPPGTSCPVVESVRGADLVLLVTEPTPFGLNDLQLAVAMVRALGRPFAVVLNRCDGGDDRVQRWCADQAIEIILSLPDDRRIAEAYAWGEILLDKLPEYGPAFAACCPGSVTYPGEGRGWRRSGGIEVMW
jgi:MinD superfamily P-loop ATPase